MSQKPQRGKIGQHLHTILTLSDVIIINIVYLIVNSLTDGFATNRQRLAWLLVNVAYLPTAYLLGKSHRARTIPMNHVLRNAFKAVGVHALTFITLLYFLEFDFIPWQTLALFYGLLLVALPLWWSCTRLMVKELRSRGYNYRRIVIVGTGLPLIGASLAKRAICPSCHPIVESGLMDCDPVEVPRSVGDNRFMAHCAVQWPNIRFVGFEANEWLHDEDRLVAFIGGAQIDPYGNVNSTCIFGKGDYLQPTTRFTGSGGANGIATYCNTIIMMQHQKRRFMDHVDYITSCGWMDGPGGRERAGLPGNRGPQMVVTDLGIMKFDEETKRMYLAYYYPFSSPEMVQENTGFEIDVSRAELMEGPSPEIIRLIREEIDPGQAFIKVPKDK